MLLIASFVLILGNFVQCADENGTYTIIAPIQIRPNATYQVSLTYIAKDDSVEPAPLVRLRIDDLAEKHIVSRDVHLISNATKSVFLPTDDIKFYKYYRFIAEGIQGISLKHNVSLRTEFKNVSIFIQTDKAIYKPADTVRFRVLVLNNHLTPAAIRENDLNVFITDAKNNRVKQWKGVQSRKGVFSDQLKLIEHPELGEWTIHAELNGDHEKKSKSFEIAEYILPKFETIIDSPDDFTVKDEKIRLIVRSKYTHGKFVKGRVIVSLRPTGVGNSDIIIKRVPLDGKGVVEFDAETELKLKFYDNYSSQNYLVQAIVLEEFTGRNHSATKDITVHPNRYKINVQRDSFYDPGIPIPMTIRVTRYGDSPLIINDETKQITLIKQRFTNQPAIYKIYELNSNGTAEVSLPTDKSDKGFDVKIKFMDEENFVGFFYPRSSHPTHGYELLKINFLTKRLRLNKNITVEVVTMEPIEMLHYLVISHGRIRVANTVRVPRRKYHVIKFPATIDLVPSGHFVAYYFKDGRLVSQRKKIELKDNSANFIRMKLSSEQLRAGDNVTIDVQTNPKSYVGLLAIDQSVLLLKSGNDLSRNNIVEELNNYYGQARGDHSGTELLSTGVYILTRPSGRESYQSPTYYADNLSVHLNPSNAWFIPPVQDLLELSPATLNPINKEEIRIRKDFPETWLWEAIDDDNFNGTARLIKTVPDTITSWTLSAFSIDPVHGLTLADMPRTLEVSQPFYIAMNLPYSVIRGEIFSVTVIVYNYLEQDVDAEINFANENDEFEFIDGDDTNQLERVKQTRIKSNDVAAHSFIIKPKKVGVISLKATATSSLVGDAVVQILPVEPEGVPHYGNEAVVIDLREGQQFDARQLEIDIPDDAVPDSVRIEIKCMGDIFGGTIQNLPKLIRLPSGCGEQNLLSLVPNVVVLKYLNATDQLSGEIERLAKEYIEKGYQRQLAYKHDDGSFSAFGMEDKNGSTWLTAFVAKSFQEASEYVDIDESVISAAFVWLTRVQAGDGSFPEVGRTVHKDMQGRSSRGITLTAYTLIAFLKHPDNRNYSSTIERATNNIVKNIDVVDDDLYALAVVAYALQLANHPLKAETLDKLLNLAENKGNQRFWSKLKDFENRKRIASKTINVEITSYGLLALTEANKFDDGLPVLKWLLDQRTENGGFESTQDTVLGLTALAAFAEKLSVKNKDILVTVVPSDDANENIEIHLNVENALVLQTFEIPPSSRSIEVSARGNGFGLLQLSYRYHINDSDTDSVFTLKPKLTEGTNAGKLALEVCVSYNPINIADTESNMVVLEVSLPSGFGTDAESMYALAKYEYVKRVETKNSYTVFVLYFDHLKANELICPVFEAYRRDKVAEQKPVPVLVYDYYDSSQRAREFYTMPVTTSCDICEGEDCQQLCIIGEGKSPTH